MLILILILMLILSPSVFLVLAVLGWILSTLDASLTEGQAGGESQGGGGSGRNIGCKMSRQGLKHRKPNT